MSTKNTTAGTHRRWVMAAAVAACATAGAFAYRAAHSPTSRPLHWSEVSAVGFPAYARSLLEQGVDELDLVEWNMSLDRAAAPEKAERAAVLLGAALADPRVSDELRDGAAASLLRRVEARAPAGSRFAVGADVVAARALDAHAIANEPVALALAELAAGGLPHPDLAVRVECGAVALAAGQAERVVPFLLAVLRAETPDQQKSPRTWERVTTLAWVKTRASLALSTAAGTDRRFRPDGSWAHQMEEAKRLEELLLRGR